MKMTPIKGREMHPSHAFYRRRVMGSTGSLLSEGTFERDAGEERRPHRYILDEYMLPSKITPYSSRPDKPKGLVKPIAVHANSPGSAPSSPGYIKRGAESPSLSDTHVHGQPPDVVLTNQRRGSTNGFSPSHRHFSRPPTKAVSLQEIAPSLSLQRTNGNGDCKNGRTPEDHRRLQPSQSMNYLDQNQRSRPQPFGHRGRSYSHSSIAESSQLNNHKSLSPAPEHCAVDDQSVSSHVSSIIEEVSTDEEIPTLRNQVQELESQLVSLRQAMEQNEQSILQVQEDKRHQWEGEVTRLKREAENQRERATDQEQSLHQQILHLEQENGGLKQKIDHLGESSHNLRNHRGKYPDENSNTRSGNSDRKTSTGEDINGDLNSYRKQLAAEQEKVTRLERELDRLSIGQWQETPDLVKKQSEEDRLRGSLEQLKEVNVNLTKQVSIQEDELQSLHRKLQLREKEVAQDHSELAYLKEVQDGLQVTLVDREAEIKQLRRVEHTVRSSLEARVREKERELEAVHAELRELRVKQNQDLSQLEKQVLRKESEVMHLQGQLQESESKGKPKRRSLKGPSSSSESSKSSQKNTLKQLEQDFIALQVKLTKREQETFQLRREASLKQDNLREERDSIRKALAQREGDLTACLERLQLKDEEISLSQEKLHDREREIASLYEKLERQNSRLAAADGGEIQGVIRDLEDKLKTQVGFFEEEKRIWQAEKEKVLQYQKQLQLNYMQMGQKNRKLEQEVQQLSSELERTDVIHC